MRKWLGNARPNSSTQSLSALDEPQALRDAMIAASHILNDDVETADAELAKGNSPFHKLGKGVTVFLRAVLGFEHEFMKAASECLADAEAAASDHQRRAHRTAFQSSIYPSGSEYALCHAESQLMSAVVAVLNESLTESIRGFYKLRKAYQTLQEIADAETRYMRDKNTSSVGSPLRQSLDSTRSINTRSTNINGSPRKMSAPSSPRVLPPVRPEEDEDDDLDFVDAEEGQADEPTAHYEGHVESKRLSQQMSELTLGPGSIGGVASAQTNGYKGESAVEEEMDYAAHITQPIDIFIHSGTSLCFGILQLMLSLVPPAFTKLLSIIGFRGDRDAGIQMLWRATNYDNINGAMAGLVTLGYYNGMVQFCDILTADAYPRERCRKLLGEMREKYPKSRLWLLEESRMMGGERNLEKAVKLTGTTEKSQLKQVEALQKFEHSLNCMYLHRYEECAEGFIKCIDLNNWSHGLYYFIAGSCYVELYRQAKVSDPKKAEKYGLQATELLRTVPAHANKKRFMARQLPFDVFVTRKIAKWEARALALDISFVDAVGVSPVEEMIYFWNGYKKMRPEHLEVCLERLSWSETSVSAADQDERCIHSVLQAAVLSRLNRVEEARTILRQKVLNVEHHSIKGGHKDNWTLPVAHYEMAVCAWTEIGGHAGATKTENRAQVTECAEWVDKVVKWESYDLDARVGMKIRTAQDTLKKCGVVIV